MFRFFKSNPIKKMMKEIAEEMTKVESLKHWINCRLDGEKAIVTTYVDEKALAWIEFDKAQFEDLIANLQRVHKEMGE